MMPRSPRPSPGGTNPTPAASHHAQNVGCSQSAPAFRSGGRDDHSPRLSPISPDPEFLKPILKYLGWTELLRLRLVCKEWNEVIIYHDPGLWTKCRLCFDATAAPQTGNESRAKALNSYFQQFSEMALVVDSKCPNYHFYELDGRFEDVRKFFHDNGRSIEYLRLNNCILSIVSFQRILQYCKYLDELEMNGMLHCLTHTESLFSSPKQSSLAGFSNVRKIYFQTTFLAQLIKQRIKNAKGGAQTVGPPPVEDFHPTVVREIFLSAPKVQSFTLSGFGIATVHRVLYILSHHKYQQNLVDLQFQDIPDSGTRCYCLSEMDDLSHLKLKKFAMTFLPCEGQKNVILAENGEPLENLNGVLRKLLLTHQLTLESLDLTNCNVTEDIFFPSERFQQLPALRKLCLTGTPIMELSDNSKLVLQSYLAGLGDESEDGMNGRKTRSRVDEIIDAALEDERLNMAWTAAAVAGNAEDDEAPGGGKNRVPNCSSLDTVCLLTGFVVGMLGIFLACKNWNGEIPTEIGYICTVSSIMLIIFAIYKIIAEALEN